MKPIAAVLGVVLAAFGIAAAIVFGLDDRETLVPPPEAEAEQFVRALALGRVGAARSRLTEDGNRDVTDEELRADGERISDGPGTVWAIRAETDWIAGDRAAATATCRGRAGEEKLSLVLEREKGLWRIAKLGAPGLAPLSSTSLVEQASVAIRSQKVQSMPTRPANPAAG